MNNLIRHVQIALHISIYTLFFMLATTVAAQERPSSIAGETSEKLFKQDQELINIADRLIEENNYEAAFDTLVYGIKQFDLKLNQDDVEAMRQTKVYLNLLDALTNRAFDHDTYGQFLSLEDRIPLLEEFIKLSEGPQVDSLLAVKTYILGVTHNLLTNYQESIASLEKANVISKSNGYHELLLLGLFQLSKGYRNIGDRKTSLEKLIEYEKRSEEHAIAYHVQTSTEALGNFYLNQKDYAQSVAYYKRAIQLAEEFEMDTHYSLTSLAISYDESDSISKARQAYQKAFDLLNADPDDQDYHYKLAGLALNYGTFFNAKIQDYDSALIMFDKGLKAAEAIDYKYYMVYAREGIAEAYHAMDRNQEALQTRLDNYELMKEVGEIELMRQAEEGLSESYERLGQYQLALQHFHHSKVWSDSLFNLGKVQALAAMETEFETEKKEQEIALLNTQNERQKARQTGLLIIGGLLLIIAVVAFVALRSKQRANRLINRQKEDLAKTNQELNRVSRFKESLTHMIVHDMKNPLNAVIGLSVGDATSKKMGTINQSGKQILNMVSNMLDIQKFEEAKFKLNTAPHRLDTLLTEAILHLELLIHAKNLTLKKSFGNSLCVDVDGELVVRILGNLLSNAIKFSELGSEIEVRQPAETKDGFVTVEVRDQGRGIPEGQLEQVFDKYWQGAQQPAYTSSTGLGLTFCKLAVEAHGGNITVQSKPGEFTIFSFTLPVAHIDESEVLAQPEALEREESLILESDIVVLGKYISELGSLKIHQVGKINRIIRQMDQEEVKSPWKTNLVSAMHQGDQARFDELIKMLK